MARKTFIITPVMIWAFFSCAPSADATLVIVGITAEVTSVSDGTGTGLLESRINVGDTITGVYIYDLSTPDSDPGARRGFYEHDAPPYGITLMVGGTVFMTNPENVEFTVIVKNDFCTVADCYDALELESRNNLPLENAFPVEFISLELRGPYATDTYASPLSRDALDALPTIAPVLEDWETGIISIEGWRARQYLFTIKGNLTSAVLIPEPATIWLIGLGGLILLKKRFPYPVFFFSLP